MTAPPPPETEASAGPPGLTVHCARHPSVETALRCSKCETPICPRCSYETPVGMRCHDCARLKKVPAYDLNMGLYLRALGAALGSGLGLGIAWLFIAPYLRFVLLVDLLVAAGVGFLIAEAATRAARYKRGLGLQVVASIGMALFYLPPLIYYGFRPLDAIGLIIGIVVVISRLR